MPGSSSTLSIVLKLVDEASSQLKSTVSGFNSSLHDLEPIFQRVAVASGVAFAAIGGEIYAATNEARESIKIHNQLNAVLTSTKGVAGVTAEAALKLANAMQDVTNYDDDAVASMENVLLTFTNINKDIFPQTTELVLDMATAMHEDLKEAAIQVGKALQDPVLGMTALRRVGVNFTQEQQDVVQQLVETGQAAKAQALIMAELQREFGGSARAAADPVIQLQNAVGDLQKEIGKALVPVLNQVVQAIMPVVTHIMEWVDAHPKLTAAILLVGAAIAGLTLLVSSLALVFAGLGTVAAALGIGLLPLLLTMGAIPLVIAAIIAIGYLLIQHWDQIRLGAQIVWASISNFVQQHWQTILNVLLPGMGFLVKFIFDHWTEIKNGVVEIWDAIKGIIDAAIGAITATVNGLFDTITKTVNGIISAINSVKSAASNFGSNVAAGGSLVMHSIVPHFAAGGIVTGPTLGLVGEAGPEAIIPLSQMGGMGGITVNITGNTISSQLDVRGIAQAVSDEIMRTIGRNQKLNI